MPILAFHCTFGALAYDQILSLLVWMFEIPQSKIANFKVPVTPNHIYTNCIKHGSYQYSAPKVISTPFGIVLRKFTITSTDFPPYQTGYNMASGYTIPSKWDKSTRLLRMINTTEKSNNPVIGFTGMIEDQIHFVSSNQIEPDICDEQLHALWLAANIFV